MARVREAEGDLDGALDLLDAAQRVYMGDFSPNVRPIPALRARVLAAQGRALTLAEPEGYVRVFAAEGQRWRRCCARSRSGGSGGTTPAGS